MSSREEVETRLRERAHQLARPVQSQETHGADHLLVAIGRMRLAIAVEALRQTVTPGPVTRLPGLPSELRGVRTLRGDVVCLADTAALFGSATAAEPDSQHVVVLEDASPLGLLVDEVLGLRHLGPEDVHRPQTSTDTSASAPRAAVTGVTGDGILLVDTVALLADPRLRLSAPAPAPDEGRP